MIDYEPTPEDAVQCGILMALNRNGNRYADVHIIDLGSF